MFVECKTDDPRRADQHEVGESRRRPARVKGVIAGPSEQGGELHKVGLPVFLRDRAEAGYRERSPLEARP